MKLYYSPGACSLAPHILLIETGLDFTKERVDLKTHKTELGTDFYQINPKGSVPAIELDNKEVLTEGAVLIQYVADQKPEKNLMPKFGTLERYRAQEWLNFVSTDIHKNFSPLFNSQNSDDVKNRSKDTLAKKFDYLSKHFEKNDFLMGPHFTGPDAYLFLCLRWTRSTGPDLTKWPRLLSFMERMQSIPSVQKAMAAEGLK